MQIGQISHIHRVLAKSGGKKCWQKVSWKISAQEKQCRGKCNEEMPGESARGKCPGKVPGKKRAQERKCPGKKYPRKKGPGESARGKKLFSVLNF